MIGFNRRFSPHMAAFKKWLAASTGGRNVIITVNAGAIPQDHWTQDKAVGGGRIIGEACHFIDLARFLVDAPIVASKAYPMHGPEGRLGDCVTMQLVFADGSTASVHYLANGNKSFPKERIEVFAGGQVLQCDNFRVSRQHGGKGRVKTRSQDKGHRDELVAFVEAIRRGGKWPIATEELFEVSATTIDLAEQVWEKLG